LRIVWCFIYVANSEWSFIFFILCLFRERQKLCSFTFNLQSWLCWSRIDQWMKLCAWTTNNFNNDTSQNNIKKLNWTENSNSEIQKDLNIEMNNFIIFFTFVDIEKRDLMRGVKRWMFICWWPHKSNLVSWLTLEIRSYSSVHQIAVLYVDVTTKRQHFIQKNNFNSHWIRLKNSNLNSA
jgi:hypothetical protein